MLMMGRIHPGPLLPGKGPLPIPPGGKPPGGGPPPGGKPPGGKLPGGNLPLEFCLLNIHHLLLSLYSVMHILMLVVPIY